MTFEDYFPYTAGDQTCNVNADCPGGGTCPPDDGTSDYCVGDVGQNDIKVRYVVRNTGGPKKA